MASVEALPTSAEVVFGNSLDQAKAYAADLVEYGELVGLLGPREYARLWSRHILNSAVVAPLLYGAVADVGSGAGLPGLPLAIARPDIAMTLIEPMERRSEWLRDEVRRLGLANVSVIRARAEELVGREQFEQVTARAVSATKSLVPIVAPLVKPGGELLLYKGRSAATELDAATKVLRKYQLEDVEILTLGSDILAEPTTVVRARVKQRTA